MSMYNVITWELDFIQLKLIDDYHDYSLKTFSSLIF